MVYFRPLILALVVAFAPAAHAAYANVAPPPGWSPGFSAMKTPVTSVAAVGTFNFGTAANAARLALPAAANAPTFRGGRALTIGALSVAGQSVGLPVAMKVGLDAALAATTFSFGNPYLFAGIFAGSALLDYYKKSGFTIENGAWSKSPKSDQTSCSGGVCIEYDYGGIWYKSGSAAGAAYIATVQTNPNIVWALLSVGASGFAIFSRTDKTTGESIGNSGYSFQTRLVPEIVIPTTSIPATLDDFIKNNQNNPFPEEFYPKLPIPLPVEQPVLNPDPDGHPRPYFIPTGNPVPTPDPNVWNQPGVRVIPSPTLDSPFRVDVQPENIPQNTPVPKAETELNPTATPSPVGNPVSSDKLGLCDQYPGIAACAPAATPEAKKKFCEENPDLLVCQPDETPEVPDLEKKNADISINPDSGWGSGGGSCPADRQLKHAVFSFQPYCDFASGIRPVLIAIAWLVGGFILIGHKAD